MEPVSNSRPQTQQRGSDFDLHAELRAFGDAAREIRLGILRLRKWLADNRHRQMLAAAVVMSAVTGVGIWVWQATHSDDLAAGLRSFDVAYAAAQAASCSSADATVAVQRLNDADTDYATNNDIDAERAIAMKLRGADIPSCARSVRDLDATWMLFLASIRTRIGSGEIIVNLDDLRDLATERGADLGRLESALEETAGPSDDAGGHD